MSEKNEDINKSLSDSILNADPAAIQKAADAGTAYIRSVLRAGELRTAMRDVMIDPDLAQVPQIARAFATAVNENSGVELMTTVDRLNRKELDRGVCHSHDFCDANVCLNDAILEVTGLDAASELPEMSERTRKLWATTWLYTKAVGFHRLSALRGSPDVPAADIDVVFNMPGRSLKVALPGLEPADEHPLEVALDFWGRNPHFQVMLYDHDDEEGEPKVLVRYNQHGKIVEVVAGSKNILLVTGDSLFRNPTDTGDTPWEIERDANPVCAAGDKLQMPSGQVATVMRLRDRYDNNIESFRAYDRNYGILNRLDGYPNSDPRHQVYDSVEQAWEVNPLTAGTVNPGDLSTVPEYLSPPSNAEDPET